MMITKKILLLLLICLSLTGCSSKKEEQPALKKEVINENEGKDYVEPYLDENPIVLGLYKNQNGTRNLITTYSSPLTQYQDIISLEVYYTKEQTLIGNQKKLWNNYYQTYQDIDTYKIGYYLEFEVGEEKIKQTILTPTDTNSISNYILSYLYDDINQAGGWYDHITEEEVTEQTIYTSIKLTASTDIAKISSPITVTAFTYDNDDFDTNNHYRGNSLYQVTINRQ